MDELTRRRLRLGIIAVILVMVLGWLARSRPFLVVPAGERAVVFNVLTGVEDRVLNEGLNILIPLVQYPSLYAVRTQTYTMAAAGEDGQATDPNPLLALTKDGQYVTLDMTVLYRPNVEKLPDLFREIGPGDEYVAKVVRPYLRSASRMAVSQHTVTQIYSGNRELLERDIASRLTEAFAACHLVLEEVKLRNVGFSPKFQEAIEKKQVAEQEIERMEYILAQAKTDRDKAIAQAEGEASAIGLVADSLSRNPLLVDYEYVTRLNPNAEVVVVQGSTILNLGELLGAKQ